MPLYMTVHSHVAMLLPVGAARPICLNILGKKPRTIHAFQIVADFPCLSHSHELDRLNLGSAFVRSTKTPRSNHVPDPSSMPIKDAAKSYLVHLIFSLFLSSTCVKSLLAN